MIYLYWYCIGLPEHSANNIKQDDISHGDAMELLFQQKIKMEIFIEHNLDNLATTLPFFTSPLIILSKSSMSRLSKVIKQLNDTSYRYYIDAILSIGCRQ